MKVGSRSIGSSSFLFNSGTVRHVLFSFRLALKIVLVDEV